MEKIEVITEFHHPVRFYWQGQWAAITKVQGYWRDKGDWWASEGKKTFHRIQCQDKVYEIYHDTQDDNWYMYKDYQ